MPSLQSVAKGTCVISICFGIILVLLVGLATPILAHGRLSPVALELERHPAPPALHPAGGHAAGRWQGIEADDEPLYARHVTKITAAGGGDGDWFGRAVAVSGDILLVASGYDDELGQDAGPAYLFGRNTGGADNWGLVKKLTGSDTVAGDRFSYNAVAIDEAASTIAIGAYLDDEGGTGGGAAFVFERNAGGADNWGQVKKIVSPVSGNGRAFGWALDLSGDTLVIGERGYGSDSGRIYIFGRNQGGTGNWGLIQARTAPSPVPDDQYGFSVAISGDTVAVGKVRPWNPGTDHGTVYLYGRNQGGTDNWGLVQTLVAADGADGDRFGWAIDLSGDTLAVGAYSDDDDGQNSGSVYLFERNRDGADTWGQVQKLYAADAQASDIFGYDLDLDGKALLVGAYGEDDYGNASGAAYIFARNRSGADAWGQVQKLTAFDAKAEERFGQGVALDGTTVAIGAYEAEVGGVASGAVYLLERYGDAWPQQARPLASDGSDFDEFGWAVAVSDDTLVAGAHFVTVNGNDNQGAAYVFARNEGGAGGWQEVRILTDTLGTGGDLFGTSVAIYGDTIVVGAPGADIPTPGNRGGGDDEGAAYVFERNQGGADNWGQIQKLSANLPQPSEQFGWAVDVDGDQIVVGARFARPVGVDGQGAAYVFERNQDGADAWGQVAQLTADDGLSWDMFGHSVAICGDTVVVGAIGADVDTFQESGAAYVYGRNEGGGDNWGQVQKLSAGDAADFQDFGVAVGSNCRQIVVGAQGTAGGGAAYVFGRNEGGTDNWGQVRKITADDRVDDDDFGHSVAISGDQIVVGARGVDLGSTGDQGAAYLFARNEGGADGWGQTARILAGSPEAEAFFGTSVSLDGNLLAVGEPQANIVGSDEGAAYVYRLIYLAPDLSITKAVEPGMPILPGEHLTYTLTLANEGIGSATGVVLTDQLPVSLTVQSVISSGAAITDSGASPAYVWQVADLSPGAGGTITITAVLSSSLPDGHSFDNVATVTGIKPEWQTANDADLARVIVANAPAITVVKMAHVATAGVGETITYTYRLTNGGNVSLEGIVAVDDPLGAVPLGSTALSPGEGTSGELSYVVAEGDLPGPLTNTVVVTGTPMVGAVVTASDGVSVELETAGYWIYLPLILR